MMPSVSDPARESSPTASEWTALHALGWLFFSNLVGLLLATLLLFPVVNAWLAPFTYGRWMPVHLNGTLYGWTALPLVGLLFRAYLPSRDGHSLAIPALSVWSGVLLFGCISWLTGQTSGKLFMDWAGWSRILLAANFLVLSVVLLLGFLARLRQREEQWRRKGTWGKAVLWLVLLPVPLAMYFAGDPRGYPPINPDSGGATGGSLLGSTLILIAVFWSTPGLLQLQPKVPGSAKRFSLSRAGFIAVCLHFLFFLTLDHGDQSHHRGLEIFALLSLIPWLPLLVWHLKAFVWPRAVAGWLRAFAGWGTFLVLSACLMFLPGMLERWKFTNALVGHTHAAMAGMFTAFNFIVLGVLLQSSRLHALTSDRVAFWHWHAGTLLYVLSMKTLGTLEGLQPGFLFTNPHGVTLFYGLRWIAGSLMLLATGRWLRTALQMFPSSPQERAS